MTLLVRGPSPHPRQGELAGEDLGRAAVDDHRWPVVGGWEERPRSPIGVVYHYRDSSTGTPMH